MLIAGKFRLLRQLPVEGPVEVYLARLKGGLGGERAVLVRRVPPHLAKNKPTVARFLDEARLAGRLTHPGIVQVLESGEDGGTYFIALEHVFGEDLGAVLAAEARRGGRVPPPVALKLVAALLEALHAAHQARSEDGRPLHLVHRDIRPENVLLGFDGAVKLTGLGTADHDARTEHTTFGVLRGKLAYLAPEALSGKTEVRSDLYAVGALLYELLTGVKAFERQSEFHTMKAIREEAPPPASALRPELPAAVDALLSKALAKKPDDRFPDARAMLAAVEKVGGLAAAPDLAEYASKLFADKLRDRRAQAVSGKADLSTILSVVEGTPIGPPDEPDPPAPESKPESRSRARLRAAPPEAAPPEPPKSRSRVPAVFSESEGASGSTEPNALPRPVMNISAEPVSEPSAPAPPLKESRPPERSEPTEPERKPTGSGLPPSRPAMPEPPPPVRASRPVPISEVSEVSEVSEPSAPVPPRPEPKRESKPEPRPKAPSAKLPAAPIPALKAKARFRLRRDRPLNPLLHLLIPFLGLLAGAWTVRVQRAGPSRALSPLAPVAASTGEEAPLETDLNVSDEPAEPAPAAPAPVARPGKPEESLAQSVTPKDKPPAPAARQGTLLLEANPPSAVSIDGRPAGQTPVKLRLSAGRHQVMLVGPQGITKRFQVDVPAGKLAKKVVTFPYTPKQPKVHSWP